MTRDIMQEMEAAARRKLPRPPGIIFPGWFWQEWLLLLVSASLVITFAAGAGLMWGWPASLPVIGIALAIWSGLSSKA